MNATYVFKNQKKCVFLDTRWGKIYQNESQIILTIEANKCKYIIYLNRNKIKC